MTILNATTFYAVELAFRDRLVGGIPLPESMTGEYGITGFWRNAMGQLVLEARQIKAVLKDSAGVITSASRRGKGAPQLVAEYVLVTEPEVVLLSNEGRSLTAPDRTETLTLMVLGPNGPRKVLSYNEVLVQPRLRFTLRIVDDKMPEDFWAKVWQVAEELGLGTGRMTGEGRFDIVKWERLSP